LSNSGKGVTKKGRKKRGGGDQHRKKKGEGSNMQRNLIKEKVRGNKEKTKQDTNVKTEKARPAGKRIKKGVQARAKPWGTKPERKGSGESRRNW